ncbi:MAG: PHP domain-containing protein [Gemmatimonadota bacterium]
MDRHAAARVLDEIGTLLELQGENRFKVRAYTSAAKALARATESLPDLIAGGALASLGGIGPATRAVIEELAETGASSYHAELRERTPLGLLQVLRVPGLGASKVRTLHEELGVASLDDLEGAAAAGKLAPLKGFGQGLEATVLEGAAFVRATLGRRLLSGADRAARALAAYVEALRGVEEVAVAGSIRRRDETHAEAVVVASARDAAPVLAAFLDMPGLEDAELAAPDAARGRLSDGFRLRLVAVSAEAFPLAVLAETGSREHVEALSGWATLAGLELHPRRLLDSQGAAARPAAEEDVYRAIGFEWIPPELREGLGETDRAAEGTLPALLREDDLRGCFHNHTTWSDGSASVEAMARAGLERGWRYLGVADHSRAAAYAGGLGPEDLAAQRREIDAWNEQHGDRLWVFQGVEADILADGRLDLADEEGVLDGLDYVVASVHSAFALDERAQTERVLSALAHPVVTFLGHPTGRRLLQREGYRLDLEAVLQFAAAAGVAIEINANPRRLDLPWRWWHRARVLGVETAINPDAHSPGELGNVRFGVDVARKGLIDPGAVWNTFAIEKVRGRLARRAAGGR